MTEIVATAPGRGGWPWFTAGNGFGTLNTKGSGPGPYYVLPVNTNPSFRCGYYAATAIKRGDEQLDVNWYSVYMAVCALQLKLGEVVDGVLGPLTSKRIKEWQASKGLVADGVFGPASSRKMFYPYTLLDAERFSQFPLLPEVLSGHIGLESGWDPGAVGVVDPRDMGIMQINRGAHPDLSLLTVFDPALAIRWGAEFVAGNFSYFQNSKSLVETAAEAPVGNKYASFNQGLLRLAVASYNLGRGGATTWARNGCKQFHGKTDVYAYIKLVEGQVVWRKVPTMNTYAPEVILANGTEAIRDAGK